MIKGVLTLILVTEETNLDRSASVLECSTMVSMVVVINLPMWNLALLKSGSLARVSATSGVHQ
jgi:hypothetical protein